MPNNESISRRSLLCQSGLGLGSAALAQLLHSDGLLTAASGTGESRTGLGNTHFPPRAKSVIMLLQNG
ncbi:MAG: sulfatase, partial [Planctomycetota bacterium]|nr:sulfatase [Planctomycetota bacterium]